jgi:YidC/Oxa1 family membrane protein insertase
LKKYKNADKKGRVSLLGELDPALLVLPTDATHWNVVSQEISIENKGEPTQKVILKREVALDSGKNFVITQFWTIKEKYTIASGVEIRNPSALALDLGALSVSAGGIPTIHNQSGDKVPFRENHEIDYFNLESEKVVSIPAGSNPGFMAMITGAAKNAPKKPFTEEKDVSAKWVCVTNRYFTSILVPAEPFGKGIVAKARVEKGKDDKEFIVAEASGIISVGVIQPNTTHSISFECFTGPKKMKLLEALDPETPKIMRLYIMGMVFLEPLSRLMLTALIWLKNFCGSYGLSIILLTLIVKTIFWPVTHKANMSMRKMQKIQPMIKELRKKYKDNPQQMNTEMMKLYKEYKVNPLGGCLPMLLQMPVFLALYATLSGTVEPRQAAFLWVGDLSLPDTIFTIPGVNLPIRPLMLMMTATMILQQKLTPTAADPAQQKVMMFMPLIMLVMLYSLPAGLTLYWTVSQFISVAQLVVNKELERREELREATLAN